MKKLGKFPRKVKGWIVSDVDFDDEQIFDTEHEAELSVDITISEVERWQCVDCNEVWEERDEAYSCCE